MIFTSHYHRHTQNKRENSFWEFDSIIMQNDMSRNLLLFCVPTVAVLWSYWIPFIKKVCTNVVKWKKWLFFRLPFGTELKFGNQKFITSFRWTRPGSYCLVFKMLIFERTFACCQHCFIRLLVWVDPQFLFVRNVSLTPRDFGARLGCKLLDCSQRH